MIFWVFFGFICLEKELQIIHKFFCFSHLVRLVVVVVVAVFLLLFLFLLPNEN